MRIDNTFYSQKNYRNLDLIKVHQFMQHHDTFCVHYHVELFAGMYFHTKKINYPTILFFRTGSYTMMTSGACRPVVPSRAKKKWKKVRVSVCCCVGRVVGRWADCQLLRPSVHRVGLLACTAMVPVVVLSCSSKHSLLHKTLCQFN